MTNPSFLGRFKALHPATLLLPLLFSACDAREPVNPRGQAVPVPPAEPALLSRAGIEVDPQTGTALLSSPITGEGGGPQFALLPVGPDLVSATVTCEGCGDGELNFNFITVRFTVLDPGLESYWVDFRRDPSGRSAGAMTCNNCSVGMAGLRGPGMSPLPRELKAGDVFEAVVRVDADGPGRFSIWFDLVAQPIRQPTRLIDLHPAGATRSAATAINALGEVVVTSDAGSFIWSAATGFREIPDGDWEAINDLGQVVGARGGPLDREAIFWPGSGSSQVLSVPQPFARGIAYDINNAGIIVGSAVSLGSSGGGNYSAPFLWDGGVSVQLPRSNPVAAAQAALSINEAGDIVGVGYYDFVWPMYILWQNRERASSDGGVDINAAGEVIRNYDGGVGRYYDEGVDSRFWSPESGERSLGPTNLSVYSDAINDNGVVVGSFAYLDPLSADFWGPMIPFRWMEEDGVLEPLPLLAGYRAGEALDINAGGQIAGLVRGTYPITRAVLWVPENP